MVVAIDSHSLYAVLCFVQVLCWVKTVESPPMALLIKMFYTYDRKLFNTFRIFENRRRN